MIAATSVTHSHAKQVTLDDVSIMVPDRGIVALVGPNGSGKTTLLSTLYHAIKPDEGRVTVNQCDVAKMRVRERAGELAVVAQESRTDLELTVADLVSLARLPHKGLGQRLSTEDSRIVDEALRSCGIEHLADKGLAELSGGERQRAVIARGLAQQATHLLLDEPTNHLDLRYQHEVLKLLQRTDAGIIVVLHDLNLANTYADQVVVLDQGKVVASGPPGEVLIPRVLEPIYGVLVNRVQVGNREHLIFG